MNWCIIWRYFFVVHPRWPAMLFFFFSSRRRHTRLQGDWSSDVCSSDLDDTPRVGEERPMGAHSGAIFIRQSDIVSANGDKPAIGNLELTMEFNEPFGLRSEEHTSELQSPCNLVCRLLLENKKQ